MYGENRHCKVIEDGSGANRIYALKSQVYNVNYKLRWYREIDSSLCLEESIFYFNKIEFKRREKNGR